MKILHTSDWHLGQEFYSYSRTEEHVAFLEQLEEIVRKEQPDVMALSGDIYHNATPSNAVMRLFTDKLDAIRAACPAMQIVVIAGNHDSSSRLEVTRTLWDHLGVHVIGHVEKTEGQIDFKKHILPVRNKVGELCGYVVALPHIFPHSFPLVNDDTPREERQKVFFQTLAEKVNEVNQEQLPVVMMVHMALTGCNITGHDEVRGGMEYTDISELKVDFDYLALGHIHCPQMIGERARYCGSPIPVNFEENYPHSVTIVDLSERGAVPAISILPIHNPWPLKTFPHDAVDFEEALRLLESYPSEEKAYLRLHVKLTDVPPHNAMERACLATADKACRFCCFQWEKNEETTASVRTFLDVDQMKARSPLDIADLYYESRFGQPMQEDLRGLLKQVIRQVSQSDQ